MTNFTLCSVSVNGTACSTLASSRFSPGMEKILTAAAANHQAEFVSLMRQMPRVAFQTRKLDLFSAVALGTGNCIFRNQTQGGVGASSYISLTGTSGKTLCVPRGISWRAGSPAVLSGELIFLSSNGSTAPITVGTTAGDTTAETKTWSGDSDAVYSIDLDFGFEIAFPQDGKLYQQFNFIVSQRPRLTIGSYDSELITTAKINPGSIATLSAVLAEMADGGVRGTQRTYALTGHVETAVEGAKPGTVMVTCDGEGGVTIS